MSCVSNEIASFLCGFSPVREADKRPIVPSFATEMQKIREDESAKGVPPSSTNNSVNFLDLTEEELQRFNKAIADCFKTE